MKRYLTKEEVNKKYKGKYIEFRRSYNWETRQDDYEIRKVYRTIHENTTLGEDVGTEWEYNR